MLFHRLTALTLPAILVGFVLTGTGSASQVRQLTVQEVKATLDKAPSLREKSSLAIAFGAATWPHQLARIMLLEQIYRAITIVAGHPYHRG